MNESTQLIEKTEIVDCRASEERILNWRPIVYHPKTEDKQNKEWWKELRKIVIIRDYHSCQSCGKKQKLTIHHIIPREEGGVDEFKNLITLCKDCHDEIELLKIRELILIIGFKKRKYIKQDPHLIDKTKPIRWQQWVYGGYQKPDEY